MSLTKNSRQPMLDLETFHLRGLHPQISMGTASDRYGGWLGQIYSVENWAGQAKKRTHKMGGRKLVVEVLPIASVAEYFDHFDILELDFTFYNLLLDAAGEPTSSYRVLEMYHHYGVASSDAPPGTGAVRKRHQEQKEKSNDSTSLRKSPAIRQQERNNQGKGTNYFFLKVPQRIFARRIWKAGKYVVNPDYLDAELFTRCFYRPAVEMLGSTLKGFIFEQEYQKKVDRVPVAQMAQDLEHFFEKIPRDKRYHLELRTGSLLEPPLFQVLEKHGVGQVLSHWTWLPRLSVQFQRSGKRFFNRGGQLVVRLLTPLGVRYEDAFKMAHPFTELKENMLDPRMISDTVEIARHAVASDVHANIIVNNRAAGNAPLLIQRIALCLLEKR